MSLPAISAVMSQLDSRSDFKLCDRGRAGFQLTEGGAAVYEAADHLAASISTFQDAIDRCKGEVFGRIPI